MLLNAPNDGKKYHMIVVVGGNKAAGNALNQKRKVKKNSLQAKIQM